MELDYAWPGNVRHLEQLAVRLTLEEFVEPVSALDLARLLETDDEPDGSGSARKLRRRDLEQGLSAYLARAEKEWLEEGIRRYPELSKKELARKLNIGESTLHKKIKQHGIDS
jgi:DNA-binding NtrC family response regulator